MEISVIIPVYNERDTISEVVRRVQEQPFEKEIIIVDDCSTDGTRDDAAGDRSGRTTSTFSIIAKNQGKGAAHSDRSGRRTRKTIIIIQDADLEYNPNDFAVVLKPILDGVADVVYGSRFLGIHRSFMLHHYIGNKLLTLMTNVLYNNMLTDMETGYKAFRAPMLKGVQDPEQSLRLRAGDHRQGAQEGLPHLRGAHLLRGSRLCRGQEDHLARRLLRHVGAHSLPLIN